jgi:hypothetical protein
LFTWNFRELDWFGWGDILYVGASVMSLVQAFFVFGNVDDDAGAGYYLGSEFHHFIYSFSLILSFPQQMFYF